MSYFCSYLLEDVQCTSGHVINVRMMYVLDSNNGQTLLRPPDPGLSRFVAHRTDPDRSWHGRILS
jgi:hypothetical protein